MRSKNFLKILLITTFTLSTFWYLKVSAATPVSFPAGSLTISITKPTQSQVIVTEGFTVSGKAPSGVLITVTIQDEDYQKIFQVHEQNLITNATTTSDRNGDWIYIPSKNLVPGKYSITAAFQNDTTGTISTEKIFFTVADESGATSWFSIPGSTLIVIATIVIVAIIIIIFRVTGNKKRRIYLHTSAGDIPVREIVEDNIVEIVPLNEPMINLGTQQSFQVAQPVILMPQALNAPAQQYVQPVQTLQPNIIAASSQVSAPIPQLPVQTVQTRPVIVNQPVQNPNITQPIVPVIQPASLNNTQTVQPVVQNQVQSQNIIQHPLTQEPSQNLNNPFNKGIPNTQVT